MQKLKQFKENIQLIYGKEATLNRYILNASLAISIIIPLLVVWILIELTWPSPNTTSGVVVYSIIYILLFATSSGYLLWRTYRNTEQIRKSMEEEAKQQTKDPLLQKKKNDLRKQRQLQKLKQRNGKRRRK